MEKQLINLALLNGGSLSKKTKTNLDIYLKSKFSSGRAIVSSEQSAGSSAGSSAEDKLINFKSKINNINDIEGLKDLQANLNESDDYKVLSEQQKKKAKLYLKEKIFEEEKKMWETIKSDLEPLKKKK